jgi:adenosine deaminase
VTDDAHVHLEASLRLLSQPLHRSAGEQVLQSLVTELLAESAGGGADRIRLRYNPGRWASRGVDRDAQFAALRSAADGASRDHGVRLDVYATLKRESAVQELHQNVETALAGVASGLRGIDVSRSYDVTDSGSRPAPAPLTRDFLALVREATEHGLEAAAHLGWYDDADDLGALLAAGVRRIGHASPLIDRPEWDVRLAEADVTVEVCPSAFTQRTGRPVRDIPVERWLDAGIRVEVGTDHPRALNTDLNEERRRMIEAHPAWASASAGSTAYEAEPG